MLDTMDEVGYLDMPELLQNKIDSSSQVNVFPVHEYWLDIGQIEQFNQAQVDIAKF